MTDLLASAAGHKPPGSSGSGLDMRPPFEMIAILRMLVAAAGAAAVWFKLYEPLPTVSVIGFAALIIAAWPIVLTAIANLLDRRMTMELSMTIAIVAASAIAEVFTALVITFFVLMAEELEHLTVARGRVAIRDLIEFIPRLAHVRRDDVVQEVMLDQVRINDLVLVKPGEKIPVDGDVVDGRSYVDQSRITGESMPAPKRVGDAVFAGSINQMGALEIRVAKIGADTSYGRIIQVVEAAEHTRAPVQKLADQLAGYLVYVAFGCALLTYVITRDIHDTISVIIVAGACGVAAGTPLAILGGIGQAAKLGSIIKGGIHLETLGRVDTVVLDKTGTLTCGEPAVTSIRPAPGFDADTLLRLAAAAEQNSEHPLAQAVIQEASARGLTYPQINDQEHIVAKGVIAIIDGVETVVGGRKLLATRAIDVPPRVEGHIGSDIVVAHGGRFAGEIIVADPIRGEAKAAISALKQLKIRTLLMSGDTAAVAAHVAGELGIDGFLADMLPEQKLERVRSLMLEGHVVAMVGDGVNDAPALTAASLGVSMGSGADVTKESADILLIGNDLAKLVETLHIARKTRGIIWQNFAGTIIIDAIGIGLAALGFLNPLLAAMIHTGSELIFLANSARLLSTNGSGAGPEHRATDGPPIQP